MIFTPDRTAFVVLSFEGPDLYSQAGGLGVRVKGLSRSLARRGYDTHLYFIGDPDLPGEEILEGGKLQQRRGGHCISAQQRRSGLYWEVGTIVVCTRRLRPHVTARTRRTAP